MSNPLPIALDSVYFGERDGLHEYMKQDKIGYNVLDQSFVNPPKVKLQELYTGARYIISGPKGSGKTTLLWHLKRSDATHKSKVILFKSDIRKEDRDKLDKMIDLIVVEDQKKISVNYDYKTIWEWYILKNIVRLIRREDILEGHDVYRDISLILQADKNRFNTLYDKLHVEGIKGNVKLSFEAGALKSELGAEIDARRKDGESISLLDLVRLVQSTLPEIRLKSTSPIRIYFDELEFFMSSDGDGERDRRMVRDLLFAVYSVNTLCTNAHMDIVIYASVRTELLISISHSTQEINKIVSAFGVTLNWYLETADESQVLKIFENKINNTEISLHGSYTEDVWSTYFPAKVFNKNIKRYLLDLGLHRPRGVLLRIIAAVDRAGSNTSFSEDDFTKSEELFGTFMLEEFSDEISATYDEPTKDVIFNLFKGNHFGFTAKQIEIRLKEMSTRNKVAKKLLNDSGVENIIKLLFRVGMIGNHFDMETDGSTKNRQIWAVRGFSEPLMEKRFVIHQSVRKVLGTV